MRAKASGICFQDYYFCSGSNTATQLLIKDNLFHSARFGSLTWSSLCSLALMNCGYSTRIHQSPYPHPLTCNRNRNLAISTAPTKARSREPAYSQALIKIKSKSIGMGQDKRLKQADSQMLMVDGVWS